MNHRIGEFSNFDSDMGIIEMFVNCYKTNDILINESVFLYYKSQALYYWGELKKYIENDEWLNETNITKEVYNQEKPCGKIIHSSLLSRKGKRASYYGFHIYGFEMSESEAQKLFPLPDNFITSEEKDFGRKFTTAEYDLCDTFDLHVRFNKIKENFETYEKKFIDLLREFENHFNTTRKYSFFKVFDVFAIISVLRCGDYYLNTDNMNIENLDQLDDNKTFLLVNKTGFFSVNTYMYAHVSGISILGVPVGNSFYDNTTGCPVIFLNHDIGHELTLNVDPDIYILYFKLMNDKNLSVNDVEELLFIMWYNLHELYNFQRANIKYYYEDYFDGYDMSGLIDSVAPSNDMIKEFLPRTQKTRHELVENYYIYAGKLLGYTE